MKTLLAVMLLSALFFGQDATEMEVRYRTCEKHHIPSDKCTVGIYRQLAKKDSAAEAAKAKSDLFIVSAKLQMTILHSCTEAEDSDARPYSDHRLTPELRGRCSEAAKWLIGNGLADVVKSEAELVKKQACERDGHGAWIVPSAACGKACGSEPHCDVYK
jgi:hypothetical protein